MFLGEVAAMPNHLVYSPSWRTSSSFSIDREKKMTGVARKISRIFFYIWESYATTCIRGLTGCCRLGLIISNIAFLPLAHFCV